MATETIKQRNFYANRLNDLISKREKSIEQQMANYRNELEKLYPTDEIEKTRKVVDAFDEVIALENGLTITVGAVELATEETEPIPVFEEAETVVVETTQTSTSGRAGMAYVGFPNRK